MSAQLLFTSGIQIVLSMLMHRDFMHAALTCKAWYAASHSSRPLLWRVLVTLRSYIPRLVQSRLAQRHLGELNVWHKVPIDSTHLAFLWCLPRLHALLVAFVTKCKSKTNIYAQDDDLLIFPPRLTSLHVTLPDHKPLPTFFHHCTGIKSLHLNGAFTVPRIVQHLQYLPKSLVSLKLESTKFEGAVDHAPFHTALPLLQDLEIVHC